MPYVKKTTQNLPRLPDGRYNMQRIRRALKAREESLSGLRTDDRGAGITKGPKRKFGHTDAAICYWRNRVLGEEYPALAKEYGVSMETMRRRTREVREAGNITLVGRGELQELFPDGLDG